MGCGETGFIEKNVYPPDHNPRLSWTHLIQGSIRWLTFFVRPPTTSLDQRRHRIGWGRIGCGTLSLILIGYVALASTVFLFARFVQRIDGVRYGDLLWPPQWAHYRIARGDHHIATAVRLAASGQRRQALLVVRTGLAHSPANRNGRLLLADLLTEAGQPDQARDVLLDGSEFHHRDPNYVATLCVLLLRQQQDNRVIALAHRLLPASADPTEWACVLGLAAATACYFHSDCDGAEEFLRSVPSLANSQRGRLLAAKIEQDRGRGELALLRLRELAAENPDDGEIHSELATQLNRGGLADEALRSTLAFQIAHPALPGPRLELLRAYRQTGDIGRTNREADAFVRDFASDATALLTLAEIAANTGDVALAHRLCEHAAARQFSRGIHAILVVEALVVARDFEGAVAAGQALLRENPNPSAEFTAVVNSLLALAHFGLRDDETGRRLLAQHLNQATLRAENLVALAQRLLDVDAVTHARTVLARAVAADPRNQTALTRLVELDLNTNHLDELPAHLTRLLAMRRPSPEVLRVAQHKLGSDRFLFSPERPAVLRAVRAALEKTSPAVSRK